MAPLESKIKFFIYFINHYFNNLGANAANLQSKKARNENLAMQCIVLQINAFQTFLARVEVNLILYNV